MMTDPVATPRASVRFPRPSRMALIGFNVAAIALVVYWLSNWAFDAGRGDFFYLHPGFHRL